MKSGFVHLRVHTEYSLVDGLFKVPKLARAVAEMGMPAVAVTEQSNFFSMVKFYRAGLATGVKPILGVDIWLETDAVDKGLSRVTLLIRDFAGYQRVSNLVSRSYLEGQQRGVPVIQWDWMESVRDSVVVLSGAGEGEIGKAIASDRMGIADEIVQRWKQLLGDNFFIELQRTGRAGEEDYVHAAVALAAKHQVPVVATNDVRFLHREDFEAHEARICINQGRVLDDPRRPRDYSEQQYLRSVDEMAELFADIPSALSNTVEIAKRCSVELTLGKNVLPDFPVPEGQDVSSYLAAESRKGVELRLHGIGPESSEERAAWRKIYDDRLEFELKVIVDMGFPGYFLIVADFIQWARDQSIPVGPGRGSGAGSLVAYALKITDLDPIEHELLFERFLNPERVSMPDFDVDFCMDRRDEVIDYVARRYGRDHVSQIITYGSMKAKAVVRDVGRVLGHPYGFVDKLAKLIPFDLGMTLDKALDQEEELRRLYNEDEDVSALIDLSRSLEGIARNAGKHAGGVVIAPTALTDFSPLYCEPGGQSVVAQFDKDDVEAVGLVKFDFLGLRTLTIIDWALATVNETRELEGVDKIDISAIPMDDEASFRLLKDCATTAVFQLESRGMKDLIKRLQPDSFEDIVALVALFRPGPLQSGMVDDFIDRKHGRAAVAYPHRDLEPILKPTYGVILYQEQVMQIAQVLAGYSLGGADMLRRAMGKKKPEEMARQREIFQTGALAHGVEAKTATYIFDLMEKFAGYGFNKSHSAAYALVSFQTAWLKAHFPAAFMAAVLSSDMDNTDKVVVLIDECRQMKLPVNPPNVNYSRYKFTVDTDDSIIYGLGAIKGVGEGAIEAMIEERHDHGPFLGLHDFCHRVDLRKVNRRVLEALIRAGAMDSFDWNRATLMAELPTAVKTADQHSHNTNSGQDDLFGLGDQAPQSEATPSPQPKQALDEWDDEQRLLGEKETLGLYLTGHPINRYAKELARFTSGTIAELCENVGARRSSTVVLAGLVIAIRTLQTSRGGKMAFLTLDDSTARVEVGVFSDTYERYKDLLVRDRLLVVEGTLGEDDYTGGQRMSADRMLEIDQARELFARCLVVSWSGANSGEFFAGLEESLTPFREGDCPVWIDYSADGARAPIMLGHAWKVHPTDELLSRLRQLTDPESVDVRY